MADDPYEIFTLFFDDETLTILANNTNEYAQVHPAPADKPHTRTWSPTMKEELRAYIAAYVWMDVYLEKEVKDFWNTDPAKGLIHDIVRQYISLKRWEQIDRFFYVSKPLPQGQQTPFDKLEPLSEHLRKKFKDYWHTGTHLAVDETTQRFMGRTKETVNLPSKPIPKGFKIWLLANQGYVLDWLYHAKSDDGGPVC